MSKAHIIYHRDNRSPRKGDRVENLSKQLKNIEERLKSGIVSEAWASDARAKVESRAKRYGAKLA